MNEIIGDKYVSSYQIITIPSAVHGEIAALRTLRLLRLLFVYVVIYAKL
jgi:hypothetical protein